ncbi:MAG: hypothetical protein HQ472_07560 [Ignavibacteria bacterium]|nr:hypothetical protein [Ignavibacteria bacterium]
MRPDLQEAFIAKVTDKSYNGFVREMNEWVGYEIEYRICEMPIFVSDNFRRKLEKAAVDIIVQSADAKVVARTDGTIEERYNVPHQSTTPLFSVVDFAVTERNGEYVPRLIELQGFPSLLGYQYAYASQMKLRYELKNTGAFFSELSEEQYFRIISEAIFGSHDPAECALIEIDPHKQKTKSDFIALKKYIDLDTINIRDLSVQRGKLVATVDGKTRVLKRVFNRAIIDELDDVGARLNFEWNQDIDVEWAGHPNWYFRISKYIMPFLQHDSVPVTHFLDALQSIPENLHDFVLKPLYSFAGKGVNVNPTVQDVETALNTDASNWILQEKVKYAECIATPFGNNKVEIRVMLIWPEGHAAPLPVMSLARTGRSEMMGARYNMLPWTGSSGCLFVRG